MSDKTPPRRKPRLFRPAELDPSKSAPQEEPAIEPEPVIEPAIEPGAATKTAEPEQTPFNRPQDKAASPMDEDHIETGDGTGLASDDERTLPTLKDIRRGFRWTGLLLAAAGILASMAFVAWLHSFVDKLITREDWIGWLAVGLVAVVVFAALMIFLREMFALMRLKRLGRLRETAEHALLHDDRKGASKVQSKITSVFHSHASLKWGLAAVREHKNEVLTAHDRLVLVERHLLEPLDHDARRIVADSARRVSVMTAISPFVFLDMILVAVENFRMLRRLMALYGGRPGLLSQFRMIQMMITNLAASGGVAVGADLIGHVLGRQVATRLAGRIGEGVINGSLTARLGITATKLVRPLPYIEAKPTTIKAFVNELVRGARGKKEK